MATDRKDLMNRRECWKSRPAYFIKKCGFYRKETRQEFARRKTRGKDALVKVSPLDLSEKEYKTMRLAVWVAENRNPWNDWRRFQIHESGLADFVDNDDPEIERYLAEHNGD